MKKIALLAAFVLVAAAEHADAHPSPKNQASKPAEKCREVKVSKARLKFYFTEYRALETELGV